jgi:hypothetical protein
MRQEGEDLWICRLVHANPTSSKECAVDKSFNVLKVDALAEVDGFDLLCNDVPELLDGFNLIPMVFLKADDFLVSNSLGNANPDLLSFRCNECNGFIA